MAKDYYETLGISRDASKEEIKKAYKKLAKKYHPDVSKEKNAEAKFKDVNEAFSVLGDEKKRSQYDQFGSADGGQGFGGFGFGTGTGGFDFGNFSFEDIFEGFFGGRRQRAGPQRGQDLQMRISVILEDVLHGAKKTVVAPRLATCEKCKGQGAESSSDIEKCKTCHGSGHVQRTSRTPFGVFQQTGPCGDCQGQGNVIKNPCSMCDGEGRIKKNETITVNVPAGVVTGNQLRAEGKGNAGLKGGPSGDLFIQVVVEEHEIFERDGKNIICQIPLTFIQAALGTDLEVPTLEGNAKLKIPPGTQTHTLFRMKGKGVRQVGRFGVGDQLVRVIVEVPKKLNAKQKKLLKDFEKTLEKKTLKQKLFG